MNFSQLSPVKLPDDIYYNIALSMDYVQFIRCCTISKMFANYYQNNLFWQTKAMRDFRINATLYDEFYRKYKSGKNVYIYLAAKSGVSVPGVERYQDINIVLNELAKQSDIDKDVLLYFAKTGPITTTTFYKVVKKYVAQHGFDELDILVTLVEQHEFVSILCYIGVAVVTNGSMELLLKFFEFAKAKTTGWYYNGLRYIINDMTIETISNNNHQIFKHLMSHYTNDIIYHEAISAAARHGNLKFMDELLAQSTDWISLHDYLEDAVYGGNNDIINKILSVTPIYYDSGLRGASAAGNLKWVQYFIDNGATNFNKALGEFIDGKSDNIEVFQVLLKYGINELDEADLIKRVMKTDKMSLIKYLYTELPHRFMSMLAASIYYDKVEIFKELSAKTTKYRYYQYMNIALEQRVMKIITYLLQYTTYNVYLYLNALELEPLRYLYDNYPELITEWSTESTRRY